MEHNHCLGMYNRKNVSYDNISAEIYDEKFSIFQAKDELHSVYVVVKIRTAPWMAFSVAFVES